MTRLAYIVDVLGGEECEVQFLSDSEVVELGEQGVGVRRAPELDRYAASRAVPDLAWLEAGYSLTCTACDRVFDLHFIETDDGEEVRSDPQRAGNVTLCSPVCAEACRARQKRIELTRAEAAADILLCAPWVLVEQWFTGCPSGCGCFSRDRENQAARITFDGAKVGNNHYCHGCKQFTVSRGDYAAWEAARAKAKGGAA